MKTSGVMTSKNWVFYALTMIFIGVLVTHFAALFFPYLGVLAHDEVEHLRIVLSFSKGILPYIDFNENHPVLLHIFIYKLANFFNLRSAEDVFILFKGFVFLHALFVFILLGKFLSRVNFLPRAMNFLLFTASLLLLNIWAPEHNPQWIWGFQSMWQIRPDWISAFYSVLFCKLYWSTCQNILLLKNNNFHFDWRAFFSGASLAISMAILPKSVYFIAPLFLSLFVVGSVHWGTIHGILFNRAKNIISSHFIILVTFLLLYSLLIKYEISFLGVSFQTYFHYSFSINLLKHFLITYYAFDYNPWNVFAELTNTNFVEFFILFTCWFVVLISLAKKSFQHGLHHSLPLFLGIFSTALILLNMAIPAFSNGIIWPWYYVPSVLGLLICINLSFHLLKEWLSKFPSVYESVFLLFLLVVIIKVVNDCRLFAKSDAYSNLSSIKHEEIFHSKLPEEASYFSYDLARLPILSKPWTFYVMGAALKGFWHNSYLMGIGPDPEVEFKSKLSENPPDVILASSRGEYFEWIRRIRFIQGVNLTWFNEIFEKEYECIRNIQGQILFVRKSQSNLFQSPDWQPLENEKCR